jgi:hypothetical protein
MQLKAKLQALMPNIITILGDLAPSITYHVTGAYQYNPSTGVKVETRSQDITLNTVVSSYTEDEIRVSQGSKSEIFSTDKKLLIPSLSLPSITPKLTDYVLINSIKYNIISKNIDPAEAMWELCIRA